MWGSRVEGTGGFVGHVVCAWGVVGTLKWAVSSSAAWTQTTGLQRCFLLNALLESHHYLNKTKQKREKNIDIGQSKILISILVTIGSFLQTERLAQWH